MDSIFASDLIESDHSGHTVADSAIVEPYGVIESATLIADDEIEVKLTDGTEVYFAPADTVYVS